MVENSTTFLLFSLAIMDSLDWSVDPCVDFYNFSCNKWLSEHDIPSGRVMISQRSKMGQDNYDFFRQKIQDKDILRKYENVSCWVKKITPQLIRKIIISHTIFHYLNAANKN